MAKFFSALSVMRSGETLSPNVVQEAREHCKGGHRVSNLRELYQWMIGQCPELPFFDTKISAGAYPSALAAFVASCCWVHWKMHAVWAMHGEIYLARLKTVKPEMDQKSYRDHFAGASMHRANGLTHMVRCAKAEGLVQLEIPCWDAPRPLQEIATQAVDDMRTACTLRSEKYGQPGCSEGTVKAYQAALQNLADALEVHQSVANDAAGNTERMVLRLRERATNLSLTDKKILAACSAGDVLAAHEQQSLARDVRLGDNAVLAIAAHRGHDVEGEATCARCQTSVATHHGYSCRCRCLCAECVATDGGRVLECPNCGDYTEFVRF